LSNVKTIAGRKHKKKTQKHKLTNTTLHVTDIPNYHFSYKSDRIVWYLCQKNHTNNGYLHMTFSSSVCCCPMHSNWKSVKLWENCFCAFARSGKVKERNWWKMREKRSHKLPFYN